MYPPNRESGPADSLITCGLTTNLPRRRKPNFFIFWPRFPRHQRVRLTRRNFSDISTKLSIEGREKSALEYRAPRYGTEASSFQGSRVPSVFRTARIGYHQSGESRQECPRSCLRTRPCKLYRVIIIVTEPKTVAVLLQKTARGN